MLCVVGVGWVCVGIPVYLFGGWMPLKVDNGGFDPPTSRTPSVRSTN